MKRRIAVLGAGIMGSSTALFLARRGLAVTLFDAEADPFSRASRWNEGKIHLGYLYAGDPSLRTARRILPGGLAFLPLVEELLDCRLRNVTRKDDIFLVHRDSVVSLDRTRAYFESLTDLVRSHPASADYLVNLSGARLRQLSNRELDDLGGHESVVAGFAVPERSVSTRWIADRFVEALAAEPGIELKMSTRVLGIEPGSDSGQGPFDITTTAEGDGPYDVVVNALWEGRPRIDATMGIRPERKWSHRHRLALFVDTNSRVETPSVLLCTGPFGDIKNYNDESFYLSWYHDGLTTSGEELDPPDVPTLDGARRREIIDAVFRHTAAFSPSVRDIQSKARDVRLEGGWVFASGWGDLSDPGSTLHQRDHIGIKRFGSYFSVDTGKYSIAPWLALQVADAITS